MRIWDRAGRLLFSPARLAPGRILRPDPPGGLPAPEALSPRFQLAETGWTSTPASGTTSLFTLKLRSMGAKRTHFKDYLAAPIQESETSRPLCSAVVWVPVQVKLLSVSGECSLGDKVQLWYRSNTNRCTLCLDGVEKTNTNNCIYGVERAAKNKSHSSWRWPL